VSSVSRAEILELVKSGVAQGCSQSKSCDAVGIDERSYQRYQKSPFDLRRGPLAKPANKLSQFEVEKIKSIAASIEFCDLSPHQIVPRLADRGEFVASESSFYRVLRASSLLSHRGKANSRSVSRPRAYEAVKPNELYSWDITYLMTQVRGLYFYLYLFLDVFSRKIVGFEVNDRESAELSSQLLMKICATEGIKKHQLTTHADNGGSMKGATILATMQRLGVMPSFSRPSVSNDNPYSESMFKTLKYCPQFPSQPFATIDAARMWVKNFVEWYNNVHLHSGIKFVTPQSRHDGLDKEILLKRQIVYAQAKEKTPSRWSGETRNWKRIETVKLNWLKDQKESGTSTKKSIAS